LKDQLSEGQIAFYRENGFLVIQNFLDDAELDHWRQAADDAVRRRLASLAQRLANGSLKVRPLDRYKAALRNTVGKQRIDRIRTRLVKTFGRDVASFAFNDFLLTNQTDPESYYAQVFIQCQRLADTHPEVRQMVLDRRLGKLAARLAGVDGVRFWHDQALFKPPFGNPTAWHLDNPSWSFHASEALTLWVALDDMTLDNGCMFYLPGSHRRATLRNVNVADPFSALFKLYPEWREITPIACPCPAGSVVFHTGYTAHAAGVNMTNKLRRAFTISYMSDGAVFNGNKDILPVNYFKSLKVGDPLNNEKINPLVWHKNHPIRPVPVIVYSAAERAGTPLGAGGGMRDARARS
jgi:ectoine hydroxylase-related dioxygenase (phytanoyl-CoA dioxygenase family)